MSKPWNPYRSEWARRRRRRRIRFGEIRLMVLGGLLFGLAFAQYVRNPSVNGVLPPAGGGEIASPVAVRVIDGDTFDYEGTPIRIADIDTPEVNGRCAYETELASRATGRLDALLGQGPFELHPTPDGRDEDRYGRKLRIVTRDGRSIGDMLVAEGLARTWTGRREPWCA